MARVQLPIAYQCYDTSGDTTNWTSAPVAFNEQGVYRISDTLNELVIIGCNTLGYIRSKSANGSSPYKYGIYTGCVSYCASAESTVNGECTGVGCCTVKFPPGLTDNNIVFSDWDRTPFVNFSPCSYGFLVDRNYYTFRQSDRKMDNGTMMPVWLDWAIRPSNRSKAMTCAEARKDVASYACKGPNIKCTDAVNGTGPGYSCHCADGYEGNPYIEGDRGCTSKHAVETRDYSIHISLFNSTNHMHRVWIAACRYQRV